MNEYFGIQDLGTEDQKAKLWQFDELVSSPAPAAMPPTDPSKWRIWPRRDQAQSSSCVYQARAKAASILREKTTGRYIEYSAADYAKRTNKPSLGSYPVEAFEFWKGTGIGLEALEPSQARTEEQMNGHVQGQFEKDIAGISKVPAYLGMPAYDFDKLVSTLQTTGKPIPLGFFGTVSEWNQDIPTISNPGLTLGQATLRHAVCATPNVGVWNGEEGFTIEDSWGNTGIQGKGVRWITRAFFEKRNYIPGLYATTFSLEPGVQKPHYRFDRDLEFGMTHQDVRALQEIYRFEGFFPANHSGSSYFGNVTRDCTQKFQVKYGLASPGIAGYGRVGPKTRAKLNQLYA